VLSTSQDQTSNGENEGRAHKSACEQVDREHVKPLGANNKLTPTMSNVQKTIESLETAIRKASTIKATKSEWVCF